MLKVSFFLLPSFCVNNTYFLLSHGAAVLARGDFFPFIQGQSVQQTAAGIILANQHIILS